jgi:hypothetical protein
VFQPASIDGGLLGSCVDYPRDAGVDAASDAAADAATDGPPPDVVRD